MISSSSLHVEDPQKAIEGDADVVIPHAPAKKVFGRLKLSLAYGLSVTPAVWMGVWLTARGLQEARSLVGIDPGLPVMNDLRGHLSREKATNSTEDLFHALYGERITYSDTTEMKVVNGEVVAIKPAISKATRDFSIVPTDAALWEGLSVTRALLLKFSPPLHQWLVEQHSQGRIVFLSTDGDSARTNRYARFDTTSGALILYPSFFSLSDGEKVVVLAHESNHASEDPLDFFVDSYSLQSGLGTLIYRGEIANRALTLSYGATGTQTVNDTVQNWRNVAPCGN